MVTSIVFGLVEFSDFSISTSLRLKEHKKTHQNNHRQATENNKDYKN